jgi:hypothetical protein
MRGKLTSDNYSNIKDEMAVSGGGEAMGPAGDIIEIFRGCFCNGLSLPSIEKKPKRPQVDFHP